MISGTANVIGFALPVGIPGQFVNYVAPNDDVGSVGTLGQKWYVNTTVQKFDKGVDILVSTNQLPINLLPEATITLLSA